MMNGRGPEGYGGGGLWLCPQSYGLWNVRGEQDEGEEDPLVKERQTPPTFFMMIFLHYCHLLLHPLFLLV